MTVKENLLTIIDEVSKEKGFSKELMSHLVEESLLEAARKKLKKYDLIEGSLNRKTGEMELYQYREVVEYVQDEYNEISLEVALKMDSSVEIGDEVEYEIEDKEFSRVAQVARQILLRKIKEAERTVIYEEFQEKKGEILTGTVVRTEMGGRVAINFNRTEAYLFRENQIQGERFSSGNHVRVYLKDVTNEPRKESQLDISRTHSGLLVKLFEMEVPEVYDGIIEIVSAAREPGQRAKIAVHSNDPDVDPVGSCVGVRGSRVQAVINELRGEKIDIIRWSEDLAEYVANAMAPAEVEKIDIGEDDEIHVWLQKDQLSLAIGKKGQNVRLASKLLGYKIKVSEIPENSNLSIEQQLTVELEKGSLQEESQVDNEQEEKESLEESSK